MLQAGLNKDLPKEVQRWKGVFEKWDVLENSTNHSPGDWDYWQRIEDVTTQRLVEGRQVCNALEVMISDEFCV